MNHDEQEEQERGGVVEEREMGENGLEQKVREEVRGAMKEQMEAMKKALQETLKTEMEERERERIVRIRKKRGIAVCIENNVFTIVCIRIICVQ